MSPAGDDTTGMANFAPAMLALGPQGWAAAGLAGLGLVGSGGGDGNPTDPTGPTDPVDPILPAINNPDADTTLTTNTEATATVSGTGEPGSSVEVLLGGETIETIIGTDGTWRVTFEGDTFPVDGDFTSSVFVTSPGGTLYELDGPDFLIDMTPPAVAITAGALSTGDVENLAEYADGITVRGTGEAGATVTVTVADPLGNVTTITDTMVVDTIPNAIEIDPVATNNIINRAEHDAGVTITGTSVPGAVLNVTIAKRPTASP